MAKMHPAVM